MSNWNVLRARLNHDLLKNRVIPSADRISRIVEGHVTGGGLPEEACRDLDSIWAEFVASTGALLHGFDPVAPVQETLRGSALNGLRRDDVGWMRDLLVEECGTILEARCADALALLASLAVGVRRIVAAGATTPPAAPDLARDLLEVRRGLRTLSRALSELSYDDLLRTASFRPAAALADRSAA